MQKHKKWFNRKENRKKLTLVVVVSIGKNVNSISIKLLIIIELTNVFSEKIQLMSNLT